MFLYLLVFYLLIWFKNIVNFKNNLYLSQNIFERLIKFSNNLYTTQNTLASKIDRKLKKML